MARKLPPNISVTVGDLDESGLARAEAFGKAVGVKGAVPGEVVDARVVARRRGRFLALVENPPLPMGQRVAAPCPTFPSCGGCATQQLRYEASLELKQAGLLEKLEAQGIKPPALAPISASRLGYRRRARLGVREFDGEMLVGFRQSFGNRIVRMRECMTLHPRLSGLIEPLKSVVAKLSVRDSIPQVELAMGDVGTGVIVRHLQPFDAPDLSLLRAFSMAHDVLLFTQSGGEETIELLQCGQSPTSTDVFKYKNELFGLCFEFGVSDFIQVNRPLNDRLVLIALLSLELQHGDRLLDLFCGIGNFSLPAARRGAIVTGVEIAPEAVQRARSNAALNGLAANTHFLAMDLYAQHAPREPGLEYNKVLLDPPRSGVGEKIASWLPSSVARIVYVSCNPDTFATDSRVLRGLGFKLSNVRILDMFPHTSHVETMGVFKRAD